MRTLVTALLIAFSINAAADEMGPHHREFMAEVDAMSDACPQDHCAPPYQILVAFDRINQVNNLKPKDLQQFNRIAFKQAQIWGDTILEGDYYADGETQLDAVEILQKNGKTIGYRISYSETAWFTSDCDFDYDNLETLKNCPQGIITERSYVSLDKKTFFRDNRSFAEFSMRRELK